MRFLACALGGTAAAVLVALLAWGPFGPIALTLTVALLGLAAALVVALVALVRGRSRRGFRVAAGLALTSAPLLLALPLGSAVNSSNVARAKAWCEAAAAGADTTAHGPSLVYSYYDGVNRAEAQCMVEDRTFGLLTVWALNPYTGTWDHAD